MGERDNTEYGPGAELPDEVQPQGEMSITPEKLDETYDRYSCLSDDKSHLICLLIADLRAARADIANAAREAKGYDPDYPWSNAITASEITWSLGQALLGSDKACDDLHAIIKTQAEENERLRAIVGKLPTLADRKPLTPGMIVYCPDGHKIQTANSQAVVLCQHDKCYDDWPGDKGPHRYNVSQCYATEEAANAAKGQP